MLTPLYCRWKYLERDWISNTIKNQYRDMSGIEILKSAGLKVRQL